ncbi:hypothetical protein MalM25_11800 [Planctomycetes bacterium MalM25]|nr:hypothetical protein MalM25_11800 [Planctomycetes bacterium MalM25]
MPSPSSDDWVPGITEVPSTARVPAYRLHKATGQAVVTVRGKQVYLGRHNCPNPFQRYHEVCAD